MLDIAGLLKLLHATQVREKDRALLRSITVVERRGRGEGMDFFSLMSGEKSFRAASVVVLTDGHLFWVCTHTPLVQIRENPEFHDCHRGMKRVPVLDACLGMDGYWPLMVLGCISVGLLVLDRLETGPGDFSSRILHSG